MKKSLLCFFMILCLLLTGCYGYKDINNAVFVTSIIVDVDNEKKPIIYLEIFKSAKTPSKASEKAERIVLKGTGKTAFEALNNINLASSFNIDYTQNKAIIYTKKAASVGIGQYFDIFRRDIHFIIRPFIAVYDGDVSRLCKGNFEGEQFVGLFIWDLTKNIGSSSRAVESSLNQFLTTRTSTDKTDILTVLKVSNDEPNPTLVISGGAILKNDKLKDMIPQSEGEAYNFIADHVSNGSMEINYPKNTSGYVSLNIARSKTHTQITYDGKKYKVTKKINIKANIIETQDYMKLTDSQIKEISDEAQENLITACNNVYNKYKKENLDIFLIGDEIENKYGASAIKDKNNILKDTQLVIEANVVIDGTGKARTYK